MAAMPPAPITALVVMGVSGVGKTTIAENVAAGLDWQLAEGDQFHPTANIAKMSAGAPLTDADRWPWLAAVRDWITERIAKGARVVVTCSALKRAYRDVLREATARVRFVHLTSSAEHLEQRMQNRGGHFMPASLLRSQFDALEPLEADEDGLTVEAGGAPEDITRFVLARL